MVQDTEWKLLISVGWKYARSDTVVWVIEENSYFLQYNYVIWYYLSFNSKMFGWAGLICQGVWTIMSPNVCT